MPPKALDYESLNENVKKVQYAVRGELYLRASELQKEGKKVFQFLVDCFVLQFTFLLAFAPLKNGSVMLLIEHNEFVMT